MADPLPPVDPGDALGATATLALRGVLGPAVAKAAASALQAAAGAQAASYTGEVSADFKTIRRHAELGAALQEAVAGARVRVLSLLSQALERGYRAAGEAEAAALGLAFTWGQEDADALASFPIVEHTAEEHADALAVGLAFDVNGALARVISGGLPAEGLPTRLDDLDATFATRGGALVADAWHTGANAARHAMAAALSAP